jgi:hypothetical protein
MGLLDLWLVPYMDLSYKMDLDHEGLNLYLYMVIQ